MEVYLGETGLDAGTKDAVSGSSSSSSSLKVVVNTFAGARQTRTSQNTQQLNIYHYKPEYNRPTALVISAPSCQTCHDSTLTRIQPPRSPAVSILQFAATSCQCKHAGPTRIARCTYRGKVIAENEPSASVL